MAAKRKKKTSGKRAGSTAPRTSRMAVSGLLRFLREEFPDQIPHGIPADEIAGAAMEVAQQLEEDGDPRLLELVEQMREVYVEDPELRLALVAGYVANGLLAHSIRALKDFSQRWPQSPHAAFAQEQLTRLEKGARETRMELDLELACAWEEMHLALSRGQARKLEQVARETLKRYPKDLPSRNNLSLAQFEMGQGKAAVETSIAVLAEQPGNVHALGNLVRYSLALGEVASAQEWAKKLLESKEPASDRESKVAEALAFLGDWDGLLRLYEGTSATARSPFLTHAAAVAHARRGDWKKAKSLWHKSLARDPALRTASHNLENAELPDDERCEAWPHALGNYLPLKSLISEVSKLGANRKGVERLTQRVPYLSQLIPVLLDRAEPETIDLVIEIAGASREPATREALRDFALGKSGSFDLRMAAARVCVQTQLLPAGKVRLWRKGQFNEFVMTDFTVELEPWTKPHSPQVMQIAGRAMEDFACGKLESAEKLFLQAIALAPKAPDLLNNLAKVYQDQGRQSESLEILQKLPKVAPEYGRGHLSLAALALSKKDLEEAREHLQRVMGLTRLHVEEFSILINLQIQLGALEGHHDSEDTWRAMWDQLEQSYPEAEDYRPSLLRLPSLSQIERLFARGKAKRPSPRSSSPKPESGSSKPGNDSQLMLF